jgi:N-dimethylarginine dimethylaminohydrolase
MKRMCIYPKDVQLITGKSERHSRNTINTIRKTLNKEKYQLLTFGEFCTYMGIDFNEIEKLFKQ